MEEKKFSILRVLGAVFVVLLVAGASAGGTWYYLKKKADKETAQKQETEVVQSKPKDETADWKTYTDSKGRFAIKYPSDWQAEANMVVGPNYLGSNQFSQDNVLFYNSAKQVAIGINMGELVGRGGVCTKRTVAYSGAVVNKRLVVTETSDQLQPVAPAAQQDYCGRDPLTGYEVTVGNGPDGLVYSGTKYFIHSEGPSVSDAVGAEVIELFPKMMATMTFK